MGRDDDGADARDPPPRAAALVAERLGPLVAAAGTYAAIEGRPGPVAIAREIRALDPDARFAAGGGLGALLGVEWGDADRDAGTDPAAAIEKRLPDGVGPGGVRAAAGPAVDGLRSTRRAALARAVEGDAGTDGDAREHLLVALAAEKLLGAWAKLAPALTGEERPDPQLASGAAAVAAHLTLVAAGELDGFDGTARRDLLRYDAHDARRRGEPTGVDPSSLDRTAVDRALWLQGAVLARDRTGASVERGAALAGVPVAAFERALARRGDGTDDE